MVQRKTQLERFPGARMACQPSGEVLRGDELVQIDFRDESERFACQLGYQARRVRVRNWLIGDEYVRVTVTAGLSILVMIALISFMLVICNNHCYGD